MSDELITIDGPGPLNEIGTPKPAIDWNRPVVDGWGNSIKIYAIDHGLNYPVLGRCGDSKTVSSWTYSGRFQMDKEGKSDLMNAPAKTPTDAQILDMVEGKAVSL